jgi:biopolymer transport protein ExbD
MGLFATALLVANLALQPANLPQSNKDPQNSPFPSIFTPVAVVTIDNQGKTYINTTRVDREQLLPAIMQLHTQEPKIVFALNPDGKALLLDVLKIIIMMQSEGLEPVLASQASGSPPPVKTLENISKSNPKLNLGKVSTLGSLAIGIDDAGKTYINENSIELAELSLAIKQQHDQEPKTAFLINATSKTLYGDAVQVIDMLHLSRVKSLTLNIVLPNNQSNISPPVSINLCSESGTRSLMPPTESHQRPYIPCLQPGSPDR